MLVIIFLSIFRAKIPTKKVRINEIKLMDVKIFGLKIFFISKRIAPRVAGIKRLKEKLKALIGERPRRRAAKIVQPDRETPGKIANAWKKPIINAEK